MGDVTMFSISYSSLTLSQMCKRHRPLNPPKFYVKWSGMKAHACYSPYLSKIVFQKTTTSYAMFHSMLLCPFEVDLCHLKCDFTRMCEQCKHKFPLRMVELWIAKEKKIVEGFVSSPGYSNN